MDLTILRLRIRSLFIAVIAFSMLSGSGHAAGEWLLALSSHPDGFVIRICKERQSGDLVFSRLRKVEQRGLALKPLRGSEVRVATLQQFVEAVRAQIVMLATCWKIVPRGLLFAPSALSEDFSSTPEEVRRALLGVQTPARGSRERLV